VVKKYQAYRIYIYSIKNREILWTMSYRDLR
jgi:hypothetical protein